jgi:hypothetical protein
MVYSLQWDYISSRQVTWQDPAGQFDLGPVLDQKNAGSAVPRRFYPKRLIFKSTGKLPDFFNLHNGVHVVSSSMKTVLEEFATGQVEFLEFEAALVEKSGTPQLVGEYYFINIKKYCNFIDWTASHFEWKDTRNEGKRLAVLYAFKPDARVLFKKDMHGAPEIWHEGDVETDDAVYSCGNKLIWVSDKLYTELKGRIKSKFLAIKREKIPK